VSQTIAVLTTKGLVERSGDDGDQRVVRLNLTEAGQALVQARPEPTAEDMLHALSQEERRVFGEMIDLMLQSNLDRRSMSSKG
jgi:DNA-binding MarR family transcriptional regulator